MKKSNFAADHIVRYQKSHIIERILSHDANQFPVTEKSMAYASTNIALCKYWGKRDKELNLPITSSLSITLPGKGATTTLRLNDDSHDSVIVNGNLLDANSSFVTRLSQFLDLFREQKKWHLHIDIQMNIPVAAGLASSACGFASLITSLDKLFDWRLPLRDLSILARLGSGSAARSLWSGFVEWYAGTQIDGMDSYAAPLDITWPDLRVGILSLSKEKKPISSRKAMQQTVNTSSLYDQWPKKVTEDLSMLKQAIQAKDFVLLGGRAESNALAMHATMLSSWPPICYFIPETIAAMHRVWALRDDGLDIYFTEDAGPNLKLLFQHKDEKQISDCFPGVDIVTVFPE